MTRTNRESQTIVLVVLLVLVLLFRALRRVRGGPTEAVGHKITLYYNHNIY